MELKLNLTWGKEPGLFLNWDSSNSFERSVIEEIFGKEGSIIARRFCGSIFLEKMDEDLVKIIEKYYEKKEKTSHKV